MSQVLKPAKSYLPYPVRIDRITIENQAEDLRTFRLKFLNPEDRAAFDFTVGQFAELSLFGVGECPIGIASSPLDAEYVEFTVKRYPSGAVTDALHSSEVGRQMGIRGPLGNGFPIERFSGRNLVIVAGGFAVTTLRAAIRYFLHPDVRNTVNDMTVIYGARSPGELCYKTEFLSWAERDDIDIILTADKGDDSWNGYVGFVPAVLEQEAPSSSNAVCLICGPPVMLKFTLPVLKKLQFKPENTYLSLEMRMKCGIGKCGRCNVGDRYVCIHGPVFTLDEVRELPQEF